ncbi:MAG: hypothetical protein ABSE41_00875 [Bacteroidota bacterium]|jgi:hypothetical protein
MKTTLLTTLLAVGMLLRPQSMQIASTGAIPDNPVAISATQQTTPHVLSSAEMNASVGNGLTGCYQTKAENGDVYVTCCVDLWIFAVCVAVNYSAVQRIIPIL